MIGGYWNSTDGRRHARSGRRFRTALALVEQEPRQKGRQGTREASAFREAAQKDLTRSGRRGWPRAALALDLRFTTTRRQPPDIDRLAKHYLDLLQVQAGPGREPWGLYTDDRNIKMLFVGGSHEWDLDLPIRGPSIYIRCRTRADAIAELEAADELETLAPDDDQYERNRPDLTDVDSMLGSAEDFEVSDDSVLRAVAADIRFDARRALQEDFLASGDELLHRLFRGHARELIGGAPPAWRRRIERIAPGAVGGWDRVMTGLLDIAQLFMVPLPAPPGAPGQRSEFSALLEDACTRFLARHPFLTPLLVPLRVTVLVVPPVPKDLDNLALDVLPVIEKHFRPPRDPWLLRPPRPNLPEDVADTAHDEWRRRGLSRVRSIGEHGVWAYQVIELRRRPEHPPHGWMAVMLGHGEHQESLWEAAERDVDRAVGRW